MSKMKKWIRRTESLFATFDENKKSGQKCLCTPYPKVTPVKKINQKPLKKNVNVTKCNFKVHLSLN